MSSDRGCSWVMFVPLRRYIQMCADRLLCPQTVPAEATCATPGLFYPMSLRRDVANHGSVYYHGTPQQAVACAGRALVTGIVSPECDMVPSTAYGHIVVATPLVVDTVVQYAEAGELQTARQDRLECTVHGQEHCNSLVDTNLAALGEHRREPDAEMREFKDEYIGFLCSVWTPHSTEAGLMRRLCKGVHLRANTPLTVALVRQALYGCGGTGRCVIVCGCVAVHCTPEELAHARQVMEDGCVLSPDCPVCTDGGDWLHICLEEAVLMQQNGHKYVCSTASRPDLLPTMHDYCSAASRTPFFHLNRPPRTLIGVNHAHQAIQLPSVSTGACVFTPAYSFFRLVSADPRERLDAGEDCCVAYINSEHTFEDCIMANRASAQRGMFLRLVVLEYPRPVSETYKPGDRVSTRSHPWYKCDVPGEVTSMSSDSVGVMNLVKVSALVDLNNGDKLGTGHGQKGVVRMVPEQDMYVITDTLTGQHFIPDLVVACTSMTKRGTAGQLAEGFVGIDAARTGRSRTHSATGSFTSPTYSATITDGITGQLVRDEFGMMASCSWGFTRVMSLIHTREVKQHYTHEARMGETARDGSGVNMGEMEVQLLCAMGLTNVVQELRDRQGLVDVEVCELCNNMMCLCTCPQPSSVMFRVPRAIVQLSCLSHCSTTLSLQLM